MSPASRSKSKDKKASKEPQKPSAKSSGPANAGSGTPASAYNPLLGTFHTLEMSPTSSPSPLHSNGRFGNMDETDEHPGGLLVAGVEYDSVSNNGSWSGESEDHKEKSSNLLIRQETIPGAEGDKREKIRQKNERKHQRQKERRAQELHERCSGYLMSRKLEALAQQLVVMGFPHERATMALILNEGKVEQSVNWLFEGGEEAEKHGDQNLSGSNLKIDISEELARIADMETRYKCSKQDVERAVVACEGDLEKAVETLEAMKLDPPSAPPKPEETGDPPTISNGKLSVAATNTKPQLKPNPATIQQKMDDRDFNYTKAAVTVVGSSEPGNKNVSAPPAKTETRFLAVGNLQPGTVREPIIMMQRPQSLKTKQVPTTSMSSSPPGTAASWYPNGIEVMKSNGFLQQIPSTRSLSPNNPSSNQMYHQLQYKQQQQQQFLPSSIPGDSPGTGRGNGLWSRTGASPTLAAASSLGLFSGLGSTGSSGASSPVDWNTGGSMSHLDYASIDWTLDRNLSSTSPNGLWLGLPSFTRNNTHMYDLNTSGVNAQPAMRSVPIPNGVSISGLQDNGVVAADTSAGSREWTSPFEGKDLFSLPRRFVSSPSL
uniref:UBA domain-containing protein n=1 Tax=Fagus sylvatica TaxID=28930 RepID=A0A2N9GX24_FAGSY